MTEPTQMNDSEPGWERKLLERLAFETLREQRRKRRWGIFFRALGFAYVGVLIYLFSNVGKQAEMVVDGKHTALVQLEGLIAAGDEAGAEPVLQALRAAFESEATQGVVLRINTPGGSPVQSAMINDEIRRLRAKYPQIPLYAVVEDLCASGGYYVAVAADKIYVNKASLIGSIGVRMDGFGFTGAMDKLGIERRLLTAGENKAFLDPFSPQNERQIEVARQMLAEIHRQFIDAVRTGRGGRLKETPDMFSGLVWTGERSIELGLADGYGSVESVARDVIKAEDVRDFTQRENFAERFAKRFGAELATGVGERLAGVAWR